MPIHRLNHVVLYVRNVERSLGFYRDVLGFRPLPMPPGMRAAMLIAPGSTNDHDLGLFEVGDSAGPSEAGRGRVGMYHLGWELDTLAELAEMEQKLIAAGALVGSSDHSSSKSLYAQDPDGIECEIEWLLPAELVDDEVVAGRRHIRPLNIAREIERYGADRIGGIGLSRPALV